MIYKKANRSIANSHNNPLNGKLQRIILFFLAHLLIITTYSQNKNIDSLKHILTRIKTDTGKINVYNKIAELSRKIEPDTSIYYAQKALKNAEKINYFNGTARAKYLIGNYYHDKGIYLEARKYWLSSLQIYKRLRDNKGIAYNYLYLGHLYNYIFETNQDSCLWYYSKALKNFEQIKDTYGIASVYNGLAINFYFKLNYDEAIKYYQKAKDEYEKINDNDGIGNAYSNIGLVYMDQGFYGPSLDNYLKASAYYEKTNSIIHQANNFSGIGSLYIELFDFKNAEKYLNKGMQLFKKLDNPLYLAISHENFNSLYSKQKEYKKALYHSLLSYNYCLQVDNKYYIANANANVAEAYRMLGQLDSAHIYATRSLKYSITGNHLNLVSYNYIILSQIYRGQNKIDSAVVFAQKALKNIDNIKEKEKIKTLYGLLSELYSIKKDYYNAYKYHVDFKNTTDSLLNGEKIRTITGKEYEYNFAKKQREQELIQQQQKKLNEAELNWQKKLKNYGIAFSFFLLIVIILIYRNYRLKRNDNALLKEKNDIISNNNILLTKQKEELAEANSSKDKFFSIIAHDIKNPLNAMIGFTELLENRYETIDPNVKKKYIRLINQASSDLYKLLENLLSWSRVQTGTMPFSPSQFFLIDAIKPIISLLETSIERKKITIQNHCNKNTAIFADYSMIATVLRNLLTNAIKFTPENGSITVETETIENKVKVSIIDTGIGINEEDQKKLFRIDVNFNKKGTFGEKGTGLGLLLCKEFITKNNGSINVISKEGQGSTFWFMLPAKP